MSLNTKKQRIHLYNQTFLKWKVEQQLSTFEKASIELTLAIHNFGNSPTDKTWNKLIESISDLETMIEVHEETFQGIRPLINGVTKTKLLSLKKKSTTQKQTKLKKELEIAEAKLQVAETKSKLSIVKPPEKKKLNFFQKMNPWNYWS